MSHMSYWLSHSNNSIAQRFRLADAVAESSPILMIVGTFFWMMAVGFMQSVGVVRSGADFNELIHNGVGVIFLIGVLADIVSIFVMHYAEKQAGRHM